jgi:putative peptide maturation dehydrogenase
VPLDGLAGDGADELVDTGLLLSDGDDERAAALRCRDEALAETEWNRYAALFHFMTQWSGVDLRGDADQLRLGPESRAAAREYVEHHGPPPGAFPEPRDGPSVELPRPQGDGALYRALLARRTTRAFNVDAAMTAQQLGTVLHWVFGCHGYGRNVADVECIKRTSPSGGALHPIEAYPVVTAVDGVAPGIYHYDGRRHVLEPVSALDSADGRALASRFMAGQHYFGDAHVSIVLTARFYRNHWKYRGHQKAYPGILMDAAHLSQTLYLVATELGLGAFVTLAVNGRDIEERLALDGVEEGVIAMCGCGVRAPDGSPLEIRFGSAEDGV